jgi:hypothetical protein
MEAEARGEKVKKVWCKREADDEVPENINTSTGQARSIFWAMNIDVQSSNIDLAQETAKRHLRKRDQMIDRIVVHEFKDEFDSTSDEDDNDVMLAIMEKRKEADRTGREEAEYLIEEAADLLEQLRTHKHMFNDDEAAMIRDTEAWADKFCSNDASGKLRRQRFKHLKEEIASAALQGPRTFLKKELSAKKFRVANEALARVAKKLAGARKRLGIDVVPGGVVVRAGSTEDAGPEASPRTLSTESKDDIGSSQRIAASVSRWATLRDTVNFVSVHGNQVAEEYESELNQAYLGIYVPSSVDPCAGVAERPPTPQPYAQQ